MSDENNIQADSGQRRSLGWATLAASKPDRRKPDAAKRLAHELSNLVDGSLRNLSMALGRIDDIDKADCDDTNDRLRASAVAMKQMATLLHRFMDAGQTTFGKGLHWTEGTLGEATDCAMRLIDPQAREAHVTIRADVATLRNLPAGPLYPVISNALKNAVEAIGANGHIDITGSLNGSRATLRITDNGPGVGDGIPLDAAGLPMIGYTTKTGGHGAGLAVSRQIVESIDGTLTLTNREMGGAVLEVSWDVSTIAGSQDIEEYELDDLD